MNENKLKKITFIGGTLLGIGAVGYGIYKGLNKESKEIIDEEKRVILEELKVFLNAEFIFTQLLLLDDADIVSQSNKENISMSELSSVKYAKKVYEESRHFKTKEVKDTIKAWYVNNMSIIGNFLGTVSDKNVVGTFERLNKKTKALEKLSRKLKIEDELVNDEEVTGNILDSYRLTEQEIIKQTPIAIHMANLHELFIK